MIGPLCEHGVLLNRCPKDHRNQRQKLEDIVRLGGSEGEREAARRALARIDASAPPLETDPDPLVSWLKVQPSKPPAVGVRVRYPSGRWAHMDAEDVDWEMVEAHHLRWRFDGDTKEYRGASRQQVDDILRRRGTAAGAGPTTNSQARAKRTYQAGVDLASEEPSTSSIMYKGKDGKWHRMGSVKEVRVHITNDFTKGGSTS